MFGIEKEKIKTITFACVHFSVAFAVVYVLTGEWLIASLVSLIEPSINTFAYYFHEKLWKHIDGKNHVPFEHSH